MKRIRIAPFVICALIWAGCGSSVQFFAQTRGGGSGDSQIGRAFKISEAGRSAFT